MHPNAAFGHQPHPHRALLTATLVVLVLVTEAGPAEQATPAPVKVVSPDGKVHFQLKRHDAGRLGYQVSFRGRPVIESSRLAILVDGVDLAEGAEVGKAELYQRDETYPWHGVHAEARDRCNGAKIPVRHTKSATRYTLEVRAFKDGVAFRHIVPGDGKPRVADEATTFVIPAGSQVWYHDFEGHYEGTHARKEISAVRSGEWAAPPLTIKLPGGAGYAALTESALIGYSGMALQARGERAFQTRLGHAAPVSYPFRLRFGADEAKRLAKPASISGTITSPWRVVMVGDGLNAMVNSDLINNLAPPPDSKLFPKGARTEWIKPGRAVWKYLDGGAGTLEGMKEFSRLAGQLGFEYNVVEGFWQKWSDAQIRELVSYSQKLGVGIWLWKHSRAIRDPAERRQLFKRCHDLGVVGVKLDFFDHEAKELIDLYRAALRDAAEYRLLVDFHGANKPAGEARTWPNELTREAVLGLETRRLKAWAPHNTTLPFTRLLAGHADYTPVHFGDRRRETSWAHQIASAAILTSPLTIYGAHPKSILDNPAVEVIKSIPTVWDETIVLPGSEIGEMAAFARRRGPTWFVAVMNGPEARAVRLPLTFLGAGKYQVTAVRDVGDNPAAVRLNTTTASRGDALPAELRAGGGFLARCTPARAG
jgi:alpha-glucosidase